MSSRVRNLTKAQYENLLNEDREARNLAAIKTYVLAKIRITD